MDRQLAPDIEAGSAARVPLVGRTRERSLLQARLQRALAGERQMVLIAGEPGIGKTRLTEEMADMCRQEGGRNFLGRCDEELLLTYRPFVDAVRQFLADASEAELQAHVRPFVRELARLAPEVRERFPVLPTAVEAEPEAERYRLYEAVAALLTSLARAQPLLVVMEDLHWADQPTLQLLKHVARYREQAPLMIMGTYRQTEPAHRLHQMVADLRSDSSFEVIELAGLETDESRELAGLLAGWSFDEATGKAIQEQTEGNPFFIAEVVRSLEDATVLTNESPPGSSIVARLAVPAGVAGVIEGRLARLPDRNVDVLRIASVLGQEFDFAALVAACGMSEEAVLEAIEHGLAAHLLLERGGPAAALCAFSHALVRKTLYEGVSKPRRQRLHRQVGRALETFYGADSESHAAELALHFATSPEASDRHRAIRYAEAAAGDAMAVFAYTEAEQFLDLAVDIQKSLAPQDSAWLCDLLVKLAQALLASGDTTRVLEDIAPEALRLGESLGDRQRCRQACLTALDAASNAIASRPWWKVGDRYGGDDPPIRARVNIAKSAAMVHQGKVQASRDLLLEALALARESGAIDQEIASASFLLRLGLLTAEEERRLFNEVSNLPRERFGPLNLSSALFDAVMTHLQWGELSRASEERRALRQLAEQTHHHSAVQHSTAVDALFAMLDGRLQDALGAITASSLGTFHHAWRGRIGRWLGDAAAVEEELARMDDFRHSVYAPGFGASMLAFLGRRGEAEESVASVFKVIDTTPAGQPTAYSLLSLALEGCALGDDPASAGVLLERMSGDSRKLSKPTFVMVPRNLGRVAALLGQYEEARNLYLDSLTFCQSIGYRPELALTRLDLATLQLQHFRSERDDALRQLDIAAREFEAMGMMPALGQARTLLENGIAGWTTPSHGGLSPRQFEVLRLIAEGKTTREIAAALVLSERTVERHIADVYAKIGARNRAEATAYALSRLAST